MGSSNDNICGCVNCMTIFDDYKFDFKKVKPELNIVDILLKEKNGNENDEIILSKLEFDFDLNSFVNNINIILSHFNEIDDFKLKIFRCSTEHIINEYIEKKDKDYYFAPFNNIKYKKDITKQSIISLCDLFKKIYDLKKVIGEEKISFFIGNIDLLLADTNILKEKEEFLAYLKKIYSVEKKNPEKESSKSERNENSINNTNNDNHSNTSNLINIHKRKNSKDTNNNNSNDTAQKKINSFCKDFLVLLSKHQITLDGINNLMNIYLDHGHEQIPMNENIPTQNNNISTGNS